MNQVELRHYWVYPEKSGGWKEGSIMPVVLHTSAVKRWLYKFRHWSILIFTPNNNSIMGKTHNDILNVSFVLSRGKEGSD